MNAIGVVTRDVMITWEMKQLQRSVAQLNWALEFIDPLSWSVDVTKKALIGKRGRIVKVANVFGRVDAGCLWPGIKLLTVLHQIGLPIVNGAETFLLGRSKDVAAARLHRAGIPHPPTWVLSPPTLHRMAGRLPYPLVYKPPIGSRGFGMRLIRHSRDLLRLTSEEEPPYLIQQFLQNITEELRVLIFDRQVLASAKKQLHPGRWRANAAQGASFAATRPDKKITELSYRAGTAMNAQFAGIDIAVTPSGPVVLEVNVCPQFETLSRATGIDVAGRLAVELTAHF